MQETSAGIIIYRKTIDGPRFLILYHGRDYWNFPKGKLEMEERSFQAALREIREETGLTRNDLRFQEYFKVFEKFSFWRNNERVHKTITFYLAETNKKAIKISDEKTGQPQEGFAWFTYKEALKVLSNHKDIMRVLKQAYSFLQKKGVDRQSFVSSSRQTVIHRQNASGNKIIQTMPNGRQALRQSAPHAPISQQRNQNRSRSGFLSRQRPFPANIRKINIPDQSISPKKHP